MRDIFGKTTFVAGAPLSASCKVSMGCPECQALKRKAAEMAIEDEDEMSCAKCKRKKKKAVVMEMPSAMAGRSIGQEAAPAAAVPAKPSPLVIGAMAAGVLLLGIWVIKG